MDPTSFTVTLSMLVADVVVLWLLSLTSVHDLTTTTTYDDDLNDDEIL